MWTGDAELEEQPGDWNTRELVDRLRVGEIERFRDLYERIAPSLHAWGRLRLRPGQGAGLDPDDLLQEVWMRALEGLAEFDPSRSGFRAWVFGIAKNVAYENERRSRNPRIANDSSAGSVAMRAWPDVETSVRSRLASDDSVQRFIDLASGLDPLDRGLLVHCGLEDLPCTLAAARLGMGAEAAFKRWQRLRSRLREGKLVELLED